MLLVYIITSWISSKEKGERWRKYRKQRTAKRFSKMRLICILSDSAQTKILKIWHQLRSLSFIFALIYVYNNTFKGTNRLKLKGKLQGYNNNNYNNQYSNINNSNCNSYNYEYLNYIADYYIYMCYKYDKICTISGYCKLTGIRETVIYDWANEKRAAKLSTSAYDLWEKLSKDYESSGEARLWSGKNPIGQLATMNHHFTWNLPGVSRESTAKVIKTASELPQLSQNNTQLTDNQQINAINNSDTI